MTAMETVVPVQWAMTHTFLEWEVLRLATALEEALTMQQQRRRWMNDEVTGHLLTHLGDHAGREQCSAPTGDDDGMSLPSGLSPAVVCSPTMYDVDAAVGAVRDRDCVDVPVTIQR